MPEVFVNMDARFLQELCAKITTTEGITELEIEPDATLARLLQIARNLQSMDDRQGSEYARGFREGKASHQARSNILKDTGQHATLEEALANFRGEVSKLPPAGEKKDMKETLTVDDLDLGDF